MGLDMVVTKNFLVQSICSTAAAFLARTSGLDSTHTNAYASLICGLVSDGIWSQLDALWIFATQDSTTAGLNLVSTNFTITPISSPTFTVDRGYQGDGAASYLKTGFTPSVNGVNYALNSACFAVYNRELSNAGSGNWMGVLTDSLNNCCTLETDNLASISIRINESAGSVFTGVVPNWPVQHFGLVSCVRTGASAENIYEAGAAIGNVASNASTGLPSLEFYICARNQAGTANSFSTNQLAAALIGSGAINQATLYSRIQTYMTTVGANVS